MPNLQSDQTQPHMTVIAGRPTKLLPQLQSIHGVSVSCRLADGQDVHVPMSEVYRLFAEAIVKQRSLDNV